MESKIPATLPTNVEFPVFDFNEHKFVPFNPAQAFKGKKVMIVCVPGAFTPTCSVNHLPAYDHFYELIKNTCQIAEIYCLGANDSFVMDRWKSDLGLKHIKMLGDGNATFTKALGLDTDQSGIALGVRCWRSVLVIDDGKIVHKFCEPEFGSFGITSCEEVWKHIAGNKAPLPHICFLAKPGCPYCAKLQKALEDKHLPYVRVDLADGERQLAIQALSQNKTTPQMFVDGKLIGDSEQSIKWINENF